MLESEIHDALDEIARELPRLRRDAPADEVFETVGRLMKSIFRLGTALQSGAFDNEIPRPVQERLMSDGEALAQCLPEIMYYVSRWEERFHGAWEADWFAACRVRSALEFLCDLYDSTPFGREFAKLGSNEFEDIDEAMRRRAVHDGGVNEEDIPPGIPPKHWWWRAPEI